MIQGLTEHSGAAVRTHPAPERDSLRTTTHKNGKQFMVKRFKTGHDYAMACMTTYWLRTTHDAWSFLWKNNQQHTS